METGLSPINAQTRLLVIVVGGEIAVDAEQFITVHVVGEPYRPHATSSLASLKTTVPTGYYCVRYVRMEIRIHGRFMRVEPVLHTSNKSSKKFHFVRCYVITCNVRIRLVANTFTVHVNFLTVQPISTNNILLDSA